MKRQLSLTLFTLLLVSPISASSVYAESVQQQYSGAAETQAFDESYYVDPLEASRLLGFEVQLPRLIPQQAELAAMLYVPKEKSLSVSYLYGETPFYLKIWQGDIIKENKNMKEIRLKDGIGYYAQREDLGENVMLWKGKIGGLYQLRSELSFADLNKMADTMIDAQTAINSYENVKNIEKVYTSIEMSREEASEKLGVNIKLPTYVPKEFSGLDWHVVYNELETDRDVSLSKWHSAHELDIEVRKNELATVLNNLPNDWKKEDSKIDGKQANAFYIPDEPNSGLSNRKVLIWEEEDVVYKLYSDLTLEEMKKIAESI